MLSLGKIREYKGEEELETSACMAKPAFVGVLAKPAWLPAVCRVSVCPRPTSWVGVCGRKFFGGLNALLLGVLVGTSLGRVFNGTGILLWVWGDQMAFLCSVFLTVS